MDHHGPPPTSEQRPADPDWENYWRETAHGDGNTPDGWALGAPQYGESYPAKTMDAYLDPISGIEAEARVAWSDLGFTSGQVPPPISIHFASGNGEDFGTANKTSLWSGDYREVSGQLLESNRGQVEDNVKGIYWLLGRSVVVSPDGSQSASAGTTVTYTHTIRNTGNSPDVFDLALASSQGWSVSYELPDGSSPTTIPLGANETTSVTVYVAVPAGTSNGTQDVTTLSATSQTDASVNDSATDTTFVGDVTVSPDRAGSMSPGQTITYEHTITNNQGSPGTFDLTAVSTEGWSTAITDSGGTPLSSVILAPGDSTTVLVSVSVPSTATVGVQDVTRVKASLQSDPTVFDEASDTTTVREALTISPDQAQVSGAGATVSYLHTVRNSWPETRTVSLAGSSTESWPYKFYADDGVTEITEITVGPNGATEDVWVRLFVPATASYGDVDTFVATASADDGSGGTHQDTATDTTTIRQLATYATAGYIDQTDTFVIGDTVFGRGTGLGSYSEVFFVWYDADGTVVRTSPDYRVDTQGMAFDDYDTLATDPTGSWTLALYEAGDTPGVDAPVETTLFTVTFDAEITSLSATDASTVGASTTVNCSTVNNNNVAITDSDMTYVIWWDDNGDGVFGTGDTWMDPSGAPQPYSASATMVSHVTTGVAVSAGGTWSDPGWSMSNTQFPNQGTYNVTATWTDTDGYVIDQATSEFFSIPTLGWPLFLIVAIVGVAYLWRRAQIPGTEVPLAVSQS
jgi:hypothetical protein